MRNSVGTRGKKPLRLDLLTTRRAHLNQYVGFLRAIGAPVERELTAARLPIQNEDPNSIVPVRGVWKFVDSMKKSEGIPALGVEAARTLQVAPLDSGLLMGILSAPTLIEGLRFFCRQLEVESTGLEVGLRWYPEGVVLWRGLAKNPGYDQMGQYSLLLFFKLIRLFLGPAWSPERVGVQEDGLPAHLQEIFPNARIDTGQSSYWILIPTGELSRAPLEIVPLPLPRTDPRAGPQRDFVGSLRLILESHLSDGQPSVQLAAASSDMSVRSLQRRLAASGESFSRLREQARFNVAARMLSRPFIKISEIARAVGYTDASHFTRAFRRTSGVSPREYRRQLPLR
jgi:AraC-like DNA-binding protein